MSDTEKQSLLGVDNKITIGHHWVYSIGKISGALSSAIGFVMAFVLLFVTLFASNMDDNPYIITNTFHVEQGTSDTYAWPIYPTPWSGPPLKAQPVGNNLNPYYECMYTARAAYAVCNNNSLEAYSTCLEANYATQLDGCNVSSSVYRGEYPSQTQFGQCISRAFNLSLQESSTFSACLQTELWPLFAWPQDLNSNLFLGSYNWLLLSVVGFSLLMTFAIYTFWPVYFGESLWVEFNKPQPLLARNGFAWVWAPLVLSALVLLSSCLVAFRVGTTGWPQDRIYPTTLSTNAVLVLSTGAVFVYFVLELISFRDVHIKKPKLMAAAPPLMHVALGYPFLARQGENKYHITDNDMYLAAYTPTLLNTWNIAYLTDALTFLGIVGATLQVDTSDAYNIFWGIFFYRWLNVAAGYLMQEAYVPYVVKNPLYDPDAAETERERRREHIPVYPRGKVSDQRLNNLDRIIGLQVQALATHIAAFLSLASVLTIVFNPNKMYIEYLLVTLGFALFFIVPEGLKLFFHFYLVMRNTKHGEHALWLTILNQYIWFWDLSVRLVWVCLIYYGASNTPGTRPFISDTNANLTLAIKYLAI